MTWFVFDVVTKQQINHKLPQRCTQMEINGPYLLKWIFVSGLFVCALKSYPLCWWEALGKVFMPLQHWFYPQLPSMSHFWQHANQWCHSRWFPSAIHPPWHHWLRLSPWFKCIRETKLHNYIDHHHYWLWTKCHINTVTWFWVWSGFKKTYWWKPTILLSRSKHFFVFMSCFFLPGWAENTTGSWKPKKFKPHFILTENRNTTGRPSLWALSVDIELIPKKNTKANKLWLHFQCSSLLVFLYFVSV